MKITQKPAEFIPVVIILETLIELESLHTLLERTTSPTAEQEDILRELDCALEEYSEAQI